MKNIFTNHPNEGIAPQSYWTHGKFALLNSIIVVYGGILGIIHAFCPWWFPFATSTIIIKSFDKLIKSRRHVDELKEHLPEDCIRKKYLK